MRLFTPLRNLFFATIPGYLRLFTLLLLLGPALLLVAFTRYEISYTRDFALKSLEQTIALQADMIDNWFDEHANQVRTMSQLRSIRSGDIAGFRTSLETLQRNNPEFFWASFVDAAGVTFDGNNVSDREYFRRGRLGEEYITDVIYGRGSGSPLILFSSPVYDYDGRFIGLVVGSVKLQTIAQMMEQFHIGQTGETYLVNRDGLMVTESRFGARLAKEQGVEPSSRPWVKVDTHAFREASQGRSGSAVYTDYRGERVFGVYSAVMSRPQWVIIGEVDEREMLAPLYRKLEIVGGFVLVFLVLVGYFIAAFTRRIRGPMAALEQQAALIEQGDYAMASFRDDFPAAPRELLRLNTAFGDMAGRLIHNIEELNALNATLAEAEDRFRSLVENSPVGVYIISDGKVAYMNPKMEEILGYSLDEAKAMDSYLRWIHPDDREMVQERVRRRLEGKEKTASYQPRLIGKDGRVIQVQIDSTVCTIDGRRAVVGTMMDITERKAWEKALQESERRNRAVVEAIPDALVRLDGQGNFLQIISTKGAPSLTGPGAGVGKNLAGIWPIAVADKARGYIAKALATGETQLYEYELKYHGRPIYKEVRIVPSGDDEVLLVIRDITERKEMERVLEHISYHDALTGLYNRAYFEQAVYHASSGDDWPVGIIIGDLDGLKLVNDALGHQDGDALLKAAAAALKIRGDNLTVARIGGDEFAILVTSASDESIQAVCREIRDNVARYNRQSVAIPLSISLGYSIGNKREGIQKIFRRADDMMYADKAGRREDAKTAVNNYLAAHRDDDNVTS